MRLGVGVVGVSCGHRVWHREYLPAAAMWHRDWPQDMVQSTQSTWYAGGRGGRERPQWGGAPASCSHAALGLCSGV